MSRKCEIPSSSPSKLPLETELIERRILIIHGHKVMLDRDLALLYDVKSIALRQQVKRNIDRFPADFMFQLSDQETSLLLSQNVIPSPRSLGGSLPYAFTEQGIAMLCSVLRGKRAVQVNIAIMRAFVHLREILASHKDLAGKLDAMEKKYDRQFGVVFDAIRDLMSSASTGQRQPIGFAPPDSGRR